MYSSLSYLAKAVPQIIIFPQALYSRLTYLPLSSYNVLYDSSYCESSPWQGVGAVTGSLFSRHHQLALLIW